MVTNYPHPIASHNSLRATSGEVQSEGFAGRALVWLQQLFCGLTGHDTMLNFEQERISLRCLSCGHETPGWELNEVPPTVTLRGDTRRHAAIARPQLVRERQVA